MIKRGHLAERSAGSLQLDSTFGLLPCAMEAKSTRSEENDGNYLKFVVDCSVNYSDRFDMPRENDAKERPLEIAEIWPALVETDTIERRFGPELKQKDEVSIFRAIL